MVLAPLHSFVLPGNSISSARPRLGGWGAGGGATCLLVLEVTDSRDRAHQKKRNRKQHFCLTCTWPTFLRLRRRQAQNTACSRVLNRIPLSCLSFHPGLLTSPAPADAPRHRTPPLLQLTVSHDSAGGFFSQYEAAPPHVLVILLHMWCCLSNHCLSAADTLVCGNRSAFWHSERRVVRASASTVRLLSSQC